MKFSSIILSQFCLLATQMRSYNVSAFRSGVPLVVVGGHKRFVQQVILEQEGKQQQQLQQATNVLFRLCPMNTADTGPLSSSSSSSTSLSMASTADSSATEGSAPSGSSSDLLTEEEVAFLEETFSKSIHDVKALTQTLVEQLPTMKPGLIMKLKEAQGDPNETVRAVATTLGSVMEAQLEEARDILKSLLEAGEIRKMDALIGKAARDKKLDAAFFTVLNMNMQAAVQEEAAASPSATASEDGEEEGEEGGGAASRVQILQHVYTRCQEEVEKNIPPGIALLNKLLRTEVDSIRANQLKHYLCPQPNVITSPDGKEIQLEGEPRILVPPPLLVDAIGKAVKQIRTVEKAGGTDPASAATMVESCRQVAKEARMVIGENYGVESKELLAFEEGLQPVFRPDSPESPYIKGE